MCIGCVLIQLWNFVTLIACFSPFTHFLRLKDKKRIRSSVYKSSEGAKKKRRAVRRKRKGFDDKQSQKEGVMYLAGAFVGDQPGPSKMRSN